LALDPAVLRQRHIVVIALETAPRAYYPILDNPAMPGFYARRGESIVSEHHYTPRPYTTWADYALLTGVYPRIGREAGGRERGQAEGLAAILARHGYLTTYIDSYRIDWHGGDRHRTMWRQLGFQTLIDTTDDPPPQAPDPYEADLGRERRSLARALDALDDAQRRGRKAFVFVGTLFGHFDWKARPGDEDLPAAEKILRNCRAIDGVITEFVSAVGKRGLGDDLLLLVTGDHGLRSDAEFASLGETMMIGRASFNVPFALYAPGVIDSETVLPYPTSHVDVAPTLLELTGLSEPEAFFHGESMLENHLRDRVLFQLNSGLTPTDGYLWHERFFTSNHLTGVVEVGREADAADPAFENSTAGDAAIPAALRDPRAELARFRDYLNAVGRYFETLGAAGSAASPSG
jgi:arylsulfatase A-like enzyme